MSELRDWRGTPITIGCTVLYNSTDRTWPWKLGRVLDIRHDTDYQGDVLDMEWSEEQWTSASGKARGISPKRVTVWPT